MADQEQAQDQPSSDRGSRGLTREWVVAGIVAVVMLALDLWSKQWMWDNIRPPSGRPVMIWEPHLEFSFAFNRGVAFGMFADLGLGNAVFVILALVAIGYTDFMVWKMAAHGLPVFICFGAIVSGALGNLFDRLMRGGVVDFIKYNYPWGGSWPNFNVADIALVVGIAVLMFYIARSGGLDESSSEEAHPAGSASR